MVVSKTILHIDFDSFFASVEQQENPLLRGKPIGVTAAHSRTAIIAASREAKKYGVKGGSSWYSAQKLCPQMQLVSAHFVKYFEVSKKFIQICKYYSPFVEVFSIDELFMDVTSTAHLFGGTTQLIARIKKQIAQEIGQYITVSFGVSYNRMLAKMASGLEKPNGVTWITKENVDEVYAKAELTDICGIGYRIAARLQAMGVRNLLQLRTIPFASLKAEFGPHEATFLSNVAWAKDETAVVHFGNAPTVKSVGRNYALPKNEHDQRRILQVVFELCEEIALKLRRLQKKARTVGLSLKGTTSAHGRKTGAVYMDHGKDIFEVCHALYQEWQWGQGEHDGMVRQIAIWVSNLEESTSVTNSLFDSDGKKEKVVLVVDNINEVFGDHTIRNGFLLTAPKLTTVPNGFLADKWDRMQLKKLY